MRARVEAWGGEEASYSMLPPAAATYELPRKDQGKARGLRLYERFLGAGKPLGAEAPSARTEVAT